MYIATSASYIRSRFSTSARYLLAGLLTIDVIFMLLHILFSVTGFSDDRNFRISQEGGYAEHFQYGKSFLTAGLLLALAWRHRVWLFASWALVFAYIFLDDMLAFHEIMGERISGIFSFVEGLPVRPKDIGEAAIFLGLGFMLLLLVWLNYRHSNHITAKRISRTLFVMVLLLGFFGIAIDVLHSLIGRISTSRAVNIAITLLEEGSEHIILSFVLVYVFTYLVQIIFTPAALVNQRR